MNKTIIGVLMVLMLLPNLCSCMHDDNETTVASNECAITAITLGTLKRRIYTKRSDGRDTSYVTDMYAGYYPMYIDQLKHEIYNPDSLPVNTYVTAVVFSSITSNGTLAYRTASGMDTLFVATDSIDFTEPRYFTCYSYSGKAKQTYKVSVNVHQVNPEKFVWNEVATVDALRSATAQKALVKGDSLYVFATLAGEGRLFTTARSDASTWNERTLQGTSALRPRDVQLFNDRFYAVDGGQLITSTDGALWTASGSGQALDALVGVDKEAMYGLGGAQLWRTVDAAQWTAEALDDDAALLPVSDFSAAWLPMTFNPSFSYTLLGGLTAEGKGVVWKKTIDSLGVNTDPWSLYSVDELQALPFPTMGENVLLAYDDCILQMGLEGDSLSLFSVSKDGGRTWKPDESVYTRPSMTGLSGFGCVADEEHYIWIVGSGTGQVWRGRLNRLAFEQHQTAFTKEK